MDDTAQNPVTPLDTPNDLTHITQEMYKQNLELAERNKTLSLLRKIDEIVLGSVTDTQQIAQQVATAVVTEADFNLLVIFLVDKKSGQLYQLAMSQLDFAKNDDFDLTETFSKIKIELSNSVNPLARSVQEKSMNVTHSLKDILSPFASEEEVNKAQELSGVKAILTYPFVVRSEVIGSMVVGLAEEETALTQYQKDLLHRLAGVIGIAIDNALLYHSIQDANERLKQLDKLKDEFVSLASHELRTPMTIIKNYLWMLANDKEHPLVNKHREYVDRAYSSTDRLIDLVNDMLNVSRIESGRLTINLSEIDIVPMIQETVNEITPRAEELGVKLSLLPPEGEIKKAKADPERINQVLINLIGNSLKFTPKDGEITVSVEPGDKELTVRVNDSGRGIKADDLPKLFQKFGIVGNQYLRKLNSQGTGLGLYISKSIVELHNGKIWAESKGENQGATFSFTIPYA